MLGCTILLGLFILLKFFSTSKDSLKDCYGFKSDQEVLWLHCRGNTHTEWTAALRTVWNDLHAFVKQHHLTGLVWNASVSIHIFHSFGKLSLISLLNFVDVENITKICKL